jgi:hypothetical protein
MATTAARQRTIRSADFQRANRIGTSGQRATVVAVEGQRRRSAFERPQRSPEPGRSVDIASRSPSWDVSDSQARDRCQAWTDLESDPPHHGIADAKIDELNYALS